jgi:hypothetical protein
MLLLAVRCQKFGGKPSEVYGISDPVVAMAFDLAAARELDHREFTIQNRRDELAAKTQWETTRAVIESWGGSLKLSGEDRSRSTSMVDRSMAVKW